MYEQPTNAAIHMCTSWTDKVAQPLQKTVLNRRVRSPMLWRKRDPCIKQDKTTFVEPTSRFHDSRMHMYAKKLSKSSANLRTKNLQSLRGSDENVNPAMDASITAVPAGSWQEHENQLLAKLVRVHGSDWELIARQFSSSASSPMFSGEKTPSQLQEHWERIRNAQQQATTTDDNFFQPSKTVFHPSSQSSSIRLNKTGMDIDCRPLKFTPRLRSSLATPMDPAKTRLQPLHCRNSSTVVSDSIRNKIELPSSPVGSIKTISSYPKLSDWYSDDDNPNISPQRSTSSLNPAGTISSSSNNKRRLVWVDDRPPPSHRPRLTERLVDDDQRCGSGGLMTTSSPRSVSNESNPNNSLLHEMEPSPPHQISYGLTTPLKLLYPFPLDDSFFSVQTPTKAICESDQASFHLVSPPSIFGFGAAPPSASRVSTSISSATTTPAGVSLKPRALFRGGQFSEPSGRLFPPSVRPAHQQLRKPMDDESNRFPISVLTPESPNVVTDQRPTDCSVPLAPLVVAKRCNNLTSVTFPGSDRGTDSIALVTAKATVWNRRIKEEQQQKQQAAAAVVAAEQQAAAANQRQISADIIHARSTSSASSFFPFPFPVQRQPHLAIRRVLQTGFEAQWRQVALGVSHMNRLTTRLARQFLEDAEFKPN